MPCPPRSPTLPFMPLKATQLSLSHKVPRQASSAEPGRLGSYGPLRSSLWSQATLLSWLLLDHRAHSSEDLSCPLSISVPSTGPEVCGEHEIQGAAKAAVDLRARARSLSLSQSLILSTDLVIKFFVRPGPTFPAPLATVPDARAARCRSSLLIDVMLRALRKRGFRAAEASNISHDNMSRGGQL